MRNLEGQSAISKEGILWASGQGGHEDVCTENYREIDRLLDKQAHRQPRKVEEARANKLKKKQTQTEAHMGHSLCDSSSSSS